MSPDALKLSELRPCDACGGPIASVFRHVTVQIAIVKPQEARAQLGLAQMLGGSLALAEVMGPSPQPVTVEDELAVTLFLCSTCYAGETCLGLLCEKRAGGDDGE